MENKEKGQSLFEVLFAIAISALVVAGVASLASVSVRNSSYSRNNSIATRFAQEATEWLRSERDADWTTFLTNVRASATYCLDSLSWTNTGICTSAEAVSGTTIFFREVTFTCLKENLAPPPPFTSAVCADPDINNVEAKVEVSWTDAQGIHSVTTNTRFTDWILLN
jgi:type II secretory pathway pseudopilin PulG